jgi:hypothetical protein
MRALLATLLCFVAVSHGSMQTRNASDGPWSGWVRCELSAQLNEQGRSYVNQQTHTWVLTASTPAPTSSTDIKEYPATWTVEGGGTGLRQEGTGRMVADKWNTSGQPMSTTISFRVDLTGALFIALRGAQLASVGATTGQSVARSANAPEQHTSSRLNVDEYRFPLIRDDAAKTSITGSSGPVTIGNIAPGQPPRTVSTATCSWNFVRGGEAPPPSTISQVPTVAPAPTATGQAASPVAPSRPGTAAGQPTPPSGVVPTPTIAAVPGQVIAGQNPTQPVGTMPRRGADGPTTAPPPDSATAAPVQATTTQGSQSGPSARPVPRQSPTLVNVTAARGAVTIAWKMEPDQRHRGFFIYGPTMPASGGYVKVVRDDRGWPAPCCVLQIPGVPAGSQAWLIVPYYQMWQGGDNWGEPFSDASTGLRVTVTVAPWSIGPAPTNIKVQSSTGFDVIKNTCQVNIAVAWSPVPGAIGYTVLADGKPIGTRIPLNSFSYSYRQADMKLSDLVGGAFLSAIYAALESQYSNQPQFTRRVSLQVAASFANPENQGDGVSASVLYSFTTFPCSDGRNFPSDP